MSEPQPNPAPQPAGRTWTKWLLIASLAFNLLVIGAVGSRIWHARQGNWPPPGGGASAANVMGFAAQLPAERRRVVIGAIVAQRETLRPLRGEVRDARQAVREAIAADPFDAKRLGEAHTRLLDAELKLRKVSQQVVVDIAAVLTPEERRAFAAHMAPEGPRGGRKGPPGWGRGKRDDPGAGEGGAEPLPK